MVWIKMGVVKQNNSSSSHCMCLTKVKSTATILREMVPIATFFGVPLDIVAAEVEVELLVGKVPQVNGMLNVVRKELQNLEHFK